MPRGSSLSRRRSSLLLAGVAALLLALPLCPVSARASDPCALAKGATALGELASVDLSEVGDDSGIGGTGIRGGDDSGIGGTGYTGDDSGIGGTGIFGTVTAFGSVCANGLRIHSLPDAVVRVNGRPADMSALAVGQVVWIRATERLGRFETGLIEVYSAVVGQIDAVDAARHSLLVAGERVLVPRTAARDVIAMRGGFAALRRGSVVDVSGLRNESGVIVASRVTVGDAGDLAAGAYYRGPSVEELLAGSRGLRALSLEGYVSQRAEAGGLMVSGLTVDLSQALLDAERVAPGSRIQAMGHLTSDGRLIIRPRPRHPSTPEPPPPLAAPTEQGRDAGDVPSGIPGPIEKRELWERPPERPDLHPPIEKPEPIERPRIHRPDVLDSVRPIVR